MKWTKDENIFLIDNYRKFGIKKCSELLCRNTKSIQHEVCKLGLSINKEWSDKDISLLIDEYSKNNIKNLMILLNRSESSIRNKPDYI